MCEKKNTLDETNSRSEGERKTKELEDSNELKGNTMRRKAEQSRASVSCETAVSGLIFVQRDPSKERREGWGMHKIFKEILAEKFTIFDENYNHTHTWKPNLWIPSTNHIKKTKSSFSKHVIKRKIFKVAIKK